MTTYYDAMFWERFQKTSGKIGVVAFVLVVFASRVNGAFDPKVFGLSAMALFLAWANGWILVPLHLRHQNSEHEGSQRYHQTDWWMVDYISDLPGAELDKLREVFELGDDTEARRLIDQHWGLNEENTQKFLRFSTSSS